MRGRLPESCQGANVRHRAGQWVSRGWRELVGWIVWRLSYWGASVLGGAARSRGVDSASPLLTEVLHLSVVFVVQIDDFLIHGVSLLGIIRHSATSNPVSTNVYAAPSGP